MTINPLNITNLPNNFKPRMWQVNFILDYIKRSIMDYLLCAFPGTGKTWAAISLAYKLKTEGVIDKIIVVVHTDQLRMQWIKKAAVLGIQLQPLVINSYNGMILDVESFDGIVVSYQQLDRNYEVIQGYMSRYRTLAIMDEIHHCNDKEGKTWGPALKNAFDHSKAQPVGRLLITGTPWRSQEGEFIPFIRYEKIYGGYTFDIHFDYSYGDALRDGESVSDVDFKTWDGQFEWEYDFEEYKHSFIDRLDSNQSRRRLRTAISPDNQWIKDVIREADDFLSQLRETEHDDAAGLIVCETQVAAKKIASFIKKKLKQEVELIISDESNANDALSRFETSKKKWLIAVRMVSEGVDISRLRICVFASNQLTKLFFMQVVGRIIRLRLGEDKKPDPPPLEQKAYMWVPHTPELLPFMEEIKIAINAFMKERETRTNGRKNTGIQERFWFPISADDALNLGEYVDGQFYHQSTIDKVEKYFSKFPTFRNISRSEKLQIYTDLTQSQERNLSPPLPDQNNEEMALWQQKERLAKKITNKINSLVFRLKAMDLFSGDTNYHKEVNTILGKKFGYGGKKALSPEELKAKNEFIDAHLRKAIDGTFDWYDFTKG